MTVLPMVERELRAAARRRAVYRGRSGVAGLAVGVAAALYWAIQDEAPAIQGPALFLALSGVVLVAGLLAGALLTADSLSAEHREGTLGLLFLTDLKGHDIVLGKLAALAVPAVYWLLAGLPVLMVPVLLGGVTGTVLWQMAIALVAATAVTLALGMAVSVWFHDARKAFLVTGALVLWLSIGPWVAPAWMFGGAAAGGPLGRFVSPVGPFVAAATGLSSAMIGGGRVAGTRQFWLSIAGLAGLTGLCLILASAVLRRAWHVQVGTWRSRWLGPVVDRWRFGSPEIRRRRRQRLLSESPLLWLNLRQQGRAVAIWSYLGGLAVLAMAGVIEWGRAWVQEGGGLAVSILAHLGVRCALALAATPRWTHDRSTGAFELLLVSPLSVEEIIRAQMQSLRRLYGVCLLAILATDLTFTTLALRDLFGDPLFGIGFLAARTVVLVADCIALAWLSSWMAVRLRSSLAAAGAALTQVLVLPWVALLVLFVGVRALGIETHVSDFGGLGVWFGIGLAVDVFWTITAARRLERHLRDCVANPGQARGFWRGWFGGG